MNTTVELGRIAAPAPIEDETPPELSDLDRDLDVLCEQWVAWCRTRRLYGPAPLSGSVLGRLSGSTRPLRPGVGDAISSAALAAFHIAYTCQPEALDKHIFNLYYVVRAKPIKSAAASAGVSRAHFYRVLGEFRRRVHAAALAIEASNQAELAKLLELRAARRG